MTSIEFDLNGDGKLFSVLFDATPSVSHTFGAEITEHPVETGSNIADHIRARNLTVSLEAVITDYPLKSLSEASKGVSVQIYSAVGTQAATGTGNGRSIEASNLFQRLQVNGILCTVNTSLRKYENMALKEYSVTKTANDKGAIRVNLSFQEIRKVSTFDIAVNRVKYTRGQPKVNAGKKDGETVSAKGAALENKSVAAVLADSIIDGSFQKKLTDYESKLENLLAP